MRRVAGICNLIQNAAMTPLLDLWLPIVVAAVAVFFLGFLFWMVLPHHRSDWAPLPDEDGAMNALRDLGVQGPGQYSFPHCATPDAMKDPEFIKKMEAGPSGMLVVMPPGPLQMGKSMGATVVHNAVVAALIAYAAGIFLAPGAEFMEVFRLTGTMGILAYCGAIPTQSIWFHRAWSDTWKTVADGVVSGVVVGLIFAGLWPSVG